MPYKVKSSKDHKLIKKLFNIDPLDWARYPDGSLVIICPNGAKTSYTQEQLAEIIASQNLKLSAGAESGDPRAIAASSREANRNSTNPSLEQDPDPEQQIKTTPVPAAASPASQGDGGAPPPEAANAAAAAS